MAARERISALQRPLQLPTEVSTESPVEAPPAPTSKAPAKARRRRPIKTLKASGAPTMVQSWTKAVPAEALDTVDPQLLQERASPLQEKARQRRLDEATDRAERRQTLTRPFPNRPLWAAIGHERARRPPNGHSFKAADFTSQAVDDTRQRHGAKQHGVLGAEAWNDESRTARLDVLQGFWYHNHRSRQSETANTGATNTGASTNVSAARAGNNVKQAAANVTSQQGQHKTGTP